MYTESEHITKVKTNTHTQTRKPKAIFKKTQGDKIHYSMENKKYKNLQNGMYKQVQTCKVLKVLHTYHCPNSEKK